MKGQQVLIYVGRSKELYLYIVVQLSDDYVFNGKGLKDTNPERVCAVKELNRSSRVGEKSRKRGRSYLPAGVFWQEDVSSPANTQLQDIHRHTWLSKSFPNPILHSFPKLSKPHPASPPPVSPCHATAPRSTGKVLEGAQGALTAHTEGDTKGTEPLSAGSPVIALTHTIAQDRNRNNPTSQTHF